MKFRPVPDLMMNGWLYATVGTKLGVIHFGEGDQMDTFTVPEARQIRDWLNAALPAETPEKHDPKCETASWVLQAGVVVCENCRRPIDEIFGRTAKIKGDDK